MSRKRTVLGTLLTVIMAVTLGIGSWSLPSMALGAPSTSDTNMPVVMDPSDTSEAPATSDDAATSDVVDTSAGTDTAATAEAAATDAATTATTAATTAEAALSAQAVAPSSSAITSGVFTLTSALPGNYALDVPGGSRDAGTAVQLWSTNGGRAQLFRVIDNGDGTVRIVGACSGLCLGTSSAKSGASVAQAAWTGADSQRWVIGQDASGGTYTVFSKLKADDGTTLVLDVSGGQAGSGARVQAYSSNDTAAQSWTFGQVKSQTDLAGTFSFRSGVGMIKDLDVAGGSTRSGANMQIYQANGTAAQKYTLELDASTGFYLIRTSTNLVLDVSGGSTTAGANVQTYAANDTVAQLWDIRKNDDGSYTFLNLGSGCALDVAGGSISSGTNVQQWTDNGTAAQRWSLLAEEDTRPIEDGYYSITSALSSTLSLDVSGGSSANGANIQVYSANKTGAQLYRLTYDDATSSYSIVGAASGKSVDVAGGSSSVGANVQLYESNGSAAQRFYVVSNGDGTYTLSPVCSSMALQVEGGKATSGANVIQTSPTGAKSQRWSFSSVTSASASIKAGNYVIYPSCATGMKVEVTSRSTSSRADGSKYYEDSYEPAALVGSEGQNIQLHSSTSTAYQTFDIEPYSDDDHAASDGYYTIKCVGTGKYLTVVGTNVAQYSWGSVSDHSSQIWKVTSRNGLLTFAMGDKVLDVSAGLMTDYSNIGVYSSNGTVSQLFSISASSVKADTQTVSDYYAKPAGQSIVRSTIVDGVPTICLPSGTSLNDVSFGFDSTSGLDSIQIASSQNGSYSEHASGNNIDLASYGKDNSYSIWTKTSDSATPQRVDIKVSSGVRSMFITSTDPVNQGRAYVDQYKTFDTDPTCSVAVYDESGELVNASTKKKDYQSASIHGRGNSTWNSAKKPYQVKFSNRVNLLGSADDLTDKNSAAKKWVLLANSADSTGLRNLLSYKLALQMGLPNSVNCETVDLYYDGEYRGSYLLTEKVEVDKARINLNDLDSANEDANEGKNLDSLPTAQGTSARGYKYQYVKGVSNPDDITGGYLLELDSAYYRSERSWFETSAGVFVLKSPENASKEEVEYIMNQVQDAMDHLDSGSGLSQYFDMDSLAKTYVVNEYTMNVDYLCSSTYYYKYQDGTDNGSKLYAGPVWDFDTSCGTRFDVGAHTYSGLVFARYRGNYPRGAELQSAIKSYYLGDFQTLLNKTLLSGKDTADTSNYIQSIAYYRKQMGPTASLNASVWGSSTIGANWLFGSTWESNTNYLSSYLNNRNTWLKNEISGWDGSKLTGSACEYNGVDYELVFDAQFYLTQYPDLKAAFGNDEQAALKHFVTCGMAEGRQGNRTFNPYSYRGRYADLDKAFGDDMGMYYLHYINCGAHEGRTGI